MCVSVHNKLEVLYPHHEKMQRSGEVQSSPESVQVRDVLQGGGAALRVQSRPPLLQKKKKDFSGLQVSTQF